MYSNRTIASQLDFLDIVLRKCATSLNVALPNGYWSSFEEPEATVKNTSYYSIESTNVLVNNLKASKLPSDIDLLKDCLECIRNEDNAGELERYVLEIITNLESGE